MQKGNAITVLKAHNVTVGVASIDMWSWRARQARFDLGWVSCNAICCCFASHANPRRTQIKAEASGELSHTDAIALGSLDIEKLLNLGINDQDREMVAYAGGDIFSFESKAVAVIQPLRARVDLF